MRKLGFALLLPLLLLSACGGESKPKSKGRAPAMVEEAQLLRVQLEMKTLSEELDRRHALSGEWPADWSELKRSVKDPWGNDYAFEIEGEVSVIHCAGRDGEFGTDDDLSGP